MQTPDNYLIKLANYSAIALSGEERQQYLQGQVTCDVNALTEHSLLHGAHCNAKGKVFSCFRLIERQQQLLLMQPTSSIATSLAELKKFGVFAKVEIEQVKQLGFYALIGPKAQEKIQSLLGQVPDSLTPVIQQDTTSIVYLAGSINRYLLIDQADKLDELVENFQLTIEPENLWIYHEITQGFPYLASKDVDQYVPQMLNMQAIGGISFTKGCYLGQETVARMQYLGKNKRAMFALSGQATETVSNDDIIEIKLGENWRKAGDIIAHYQNDHQVFLQAVLANDIGPHSELRIKGQVSSSLSLFALPYTLNND